MVESAHDVVVAVLTPKWIVSYNVNIGGANVRHERSDIRSVLFNAVVRH